MLCAKFVQEAGVRKRTLHEIRKLISVSNEVPEIGRSLYILQHWITSLEKHGDYAISSAQAVSTRSLQQAICERIAIDPKLYFEHAQIARKLLKKSRRREKLLNLKLTARWYVGWLSIRIAWLGY